MKNIENAMQKLKQQEEQIKKLTAFIADLEITKDDRLYLKGQSFLRTDSGIIYGMLLQSIVPPECLIDQAQKQIELLRKSCDEISSVLEVCEKAMTQVMGSEQC